MSTLSQTKFLKGFPPLVIPALPPHLQSVQARQPWRFLMQFHFGEPRLHYEVSSAYRRPGYELGLHFEARDKALNRYLLLGMRRHLFEIKAELGDQVEAEMWDRGWTKVYEVQPAQPLTTAYQEQLAARLATFITAIHPIFVALRRDVTHLHR